MLFKFQHHVVRDLAWAIASPPLLIPEKQHCYWYDNEWYRDLYESSLGWLKKLDEAPEILRERLESQKDRRLGRYFETLWAFWLEQSPRFEIIEQNLPLRVDGKTLGELDFLVLDKQSGKTLHWEVAVKFYLGVGDTHLQANWHGPGKKDRLDLKVEHLLNRQSVICQRSVVQVLMHERGYQVDGCGIILKGRLFYPYAIGDKAAFPVDANPYHLHSYWVSMTTLMHNIEARHLEGKCISPLVGYGWMASADQSSEVPTLTVAELAEAITNRIYRLPLFVSCKQKNGDSLRMFIVSDGWEDDLGL